MPSTSGFYEDGKAYVRSGEPMVGVFRFRDDAGDLRDMTGRSFALVFRPQNKMTPVVPAITATVDEADVRVAFAAATANLIYAAGRSAALAYDLVETTGGSSVTKLSRTVRVDEGVTVGDAISSSTDAAPVSIVSIPPDSGGVVIIDSQGAPGLSPWAAQGKTLEEYDAALRAPAIDAAETADAATVATLQATLETLAAGEFAQEQGEGAAASSAQALQAAAAADTVGDLRTFISRVGQESGQTKQGRFRIGNRLFASWDAARGFYFRKIRLPAGASLDDNIALALASRVFPSAIGSWFQRVGPELTRSGYRIRVGNRLLATIDIARGLYPRRATLPASTVIDDDFATAITSRLMQGNLATYLRKYGREASGAGIRFRLGNRLLGTWTTTGGLAPSRLTLPASTKLPDGGLLTSRLGAVSSHAVNAAYLVRTVLDGTSRRQITSTRVADGQVFLLTSVGENYGPTITPDGKLLYFSTTSGVEVEMVVGLEGGVAYPVQPDRTLWYAFGDSMTAGAAQSPYTSQMPAGITFSNEGIGGQNTAQIVARQGAMPAVVTVTGNQIPASGPVAVTTIAPKLLSTASDATPRTMTGMLAGVAGTLSEDGADGYTFTRDAAGSAAACPAATPFIPDVAVAASKTGLILWTGRNDVGFLVASNVAGKIATAVAYLKNYAPRYLILGIVTNSGGTENNGSTGYNEIVAHNASMASAHGAFVFGAGGSVGLGTGGNHFLDVRRYLIDYGLSLAGITPTSQDAADLANDVVPSSLMLGDKTHLTSAGNGVVATMIDRALTAKGWKNG